MSDLQPHPRLHDVHVDDPSVTRVVVRRADPRAADLLTRGSDVGTSVSILVPTGGTAGQPFVDALQRWRPAGLRVETLVVEHPDDPGRELLRDRLARSGMSWRVVERPMGGRVAALAAVAETIDHEFLVLPTSGDAPFDAVASALCHMWTDGCDAAMVDVAGTALPDLRSPEVGDPSALLTSWLGLRGAGEPRRLVVLRRWVARWLFNEITRAIDPGEEVADRARLLGMGIVRMSVVRSEVRPVGA